MVKEYHNRTRTISSFYTPFLRLTRVSVRGDRQMVRHLNTSAFTNTPSISWDWRNIIPHAYKKSLGLFLHIKYLDSTIIFLFLITLNCGKLLEKKFPDGRTSAGANKTREFLNKINSARVHGAQ